MSYWAAARLQPRREKLALNFLKLRGFETYFPRIRERRVIRGRKVLITPPLFPGYAFVTIELQWHAARWSPGVMSLVMDGNHPAHVPDAEIAELRAHERDGLFVLPKRQELTPGFRPGDRLRVCGGPFTGCWGLYAGMAARERVFVLLRMFGSQRKIVLPKDGVAIVR